MKAVTWQGKRTVSVEEVPDPVIEEPTDAIIRVTSTGICGSDLHLYEVMGPFMEAGDIIGHESLGVVEELGPEVTDLTIGDRVVVPFNIACGSCFMCMRGLQSQCETTQVHNHGKGAALFGYSKLYGHIPGAQAEFLRVPMAHYGPIVLPDNPSDDRFIYLSDVLPTAWQAVKYAQIPENGTVAVFGLGAIGDMSTRLAKQSGADTVIGIDLVPERLQRAKEQGITVIDINKHGNELVEIVRDLTEGRGVDSVIEAVGMEAHGSPFGKLAHQTSSILPDTAAQKVFEQAGVDRLNALYHAINVVRRGGTLSIIGVYAGNMDPVPLEMLFDKQITVRMGQANVKSWVDEIMPLLTDDDPLGVKDFATHHLSLEEAPQAYNMFQKKEDGAVKILLEP